MDRHFYRRGEPLRIPARWVSAWPEGFVMRVDGESMAPALHDGDIVWIDPTAEAAAGAVTAVNCPMVGGYMIGRYAEDDAGAWLEKDNCVDPSYPRVFIGCPRDFAILGTLRAVMSVYDGDAPPPRAERAGARA